VQLEAAIGSHPAVAEAAAIQIPHEVKGHSVFAYVVLKPGYTMTDELQRDIKAVVRQHVGPFATPDYVQETPGLPKTRSGKIMRRILRRVATREFDKLGDLSTLADPMVVAELITTITARQ
jgi:acetyl-CoA synthetase